MKARNMKSILITGGSRGIGLEFVRQYLEKGDRVVAGSRNPDKSEELGRLKAQYGNHLLIYPLDVSDQKSRQQFFNQVSSQIDKLDILINNAGIASGTGEFRYQFGELDQGDLCRTLMVNAVSQLMMTEIFFPLLNQSLSSIVANISSNSGSIAQKKGGGATGYGYSASKAALNMFTKMLSHQLQEFGVTVNSFHPGWVRTTMLYCKNAPLEPAESISGMIRVIDSLGPGDTGKFLDWQGNELPW
jgi:NAD(P)-dependent dehydrogenase (short-subunit alcohol dehydrogenase family)